jgi:hypothetical protein
LGITGCQTELGRVEKAYEQIQTQPDAKKINFLRLKINDQDEDVRVFALKLVFSLPGNEKEKAAFVAMALQIEGVSSYQEAKNYLDQNLVKFSFQDQLLEAKLLKLVEVAPKVNRRQSVILVPMIIGKTTILRPQVITHYEKEPASQAFEKLAQELRQELTAR